jgi:hypothetical protein
MFQPSAAALNSEGDIYYVDGYTRIRRIARDGIISTIAGGDERIHSGDGAAAIDARFVQISDLAVDSKGNIYVCDRGANRVRKISVDGNIETVAGTGEPYSQLSDDGKLLRISPRKLAIDIDDSLLISDSGRHILLTIGPDRALVPYNNRMCGLLDVSAMVFDAKGLLITDGFRLCRGTRDGSSSVLTQGLGEFTGDGGPIRDARFLGIQGLSADQLGNIYVADTGNQRIRKLTPKCASCSVASTMLH